jgi:plastocyanin
MKTKGAVLFVLIAILVIVGGAYLIIKNNNPSIGQAVNTQPSQNQNPVSTQSQNNAPVSTETQAPTTSVPAPTITPPSAGNTENVNINRLAFLPQTLTIKAGDTVKWTNLESVPHRLASNSGNEINSLTLGEDEVYAHTFTAAGTYNYHDAIDQYMTGTIIVQ